MMVIPAPPELGQIVRAGLIMLLLLSAGMGVGHCAEPEVIAIGQDASALESLAANEVRRYVYLRTGRVMRVEKGATGGDRIVVTRRNPAFCGEQGRDLGPQQFLLKKEVSNGANIWWVVGGDETGTLYGAYRFAEKLGVRFGLDEDIIPDAPLNGGLPEMNETGKPRFALRGLQPFHDFNVGPDWWNAHDYKSVLSQMAKMRMNFIGLHTYPSWNPSAGPEANVWIGLPEDVDGQGNVRAGYEAGVVTTRRGWNVTPFPTSQYASGAGLLFEEDEYGPDYLLDCLEWPKTAEASTAMFNRYGDFQKDVFTAARRLGVKTCVGTEFPLGVPKELAARLEAGGMKPDDPAVIQKLYEGTFLRLMRKMPLDYYWFWTPETWLGMEPGCKGWEMTTRENVARDIGLADAAAKAVGVPFGMATSGWRLGTPDDASWTDKHTPKTWAASAINTGIGRDPVEPYFGTMTGRPKWVIGWAEDDGTAGAHCCTCWDLQLWADRMFVNSSDAARYGCEGMMAIHWRTAAISPNIMALSQAGWEFDGKTPEADAFWADWGRGLFGGDAGAEAGRLIQKFDGGHVRINALIDGGHKTKDADIAAYFAPLTEMEALRPRIEGVGNLERFDYWFNFIRASQLRVRTWVLADRLEATIKKAGTMGAAKDAQAFVRKEVLPLRLEIARGWEDMIAAYVNCAKSPGEIGTIASIESGTRARIVSSHAKEIEKLLGESPFEGGAAKRRGMSSLPEDAASESPLDLSAVAQGAKAEGGFRRVLSLPEEAKVRIAYRGAPRIFLTSKCSQMNAGEAQEIRAFVLSGPRCAEVNLHWRPLGNGAFNKVPATHRNRQAYRATLPAQPEGAVEYYLEALLDDGQKVLWPATAPAINQTTVAW
jgi:hypothetical protein